MASINPLQAHPSASIPNTPHLSEARIQFSQLQPQSATRSSSPAASTRSGSVSRPESYSESNSRPKRAKKTGRNKDYDSNSTVTSRSNARKSKGSVIASSKSTGGARGGQSLLAAVVEGRGPGAEVGMCFCDLKTSEVILCQIADSQTYVRSLQKLNLYEPFEILVPITAVEPVNSKLIKFIKENMSTSNITPVARRYFNDATGLEYIKKYVVEEGSASLLLNIPAKYFCLAATAAVMHHIEESRNATFLNHSVQFKYQACQDSMVIDCSTARNLELTINLSNHNKKETLFNILDETLTPMGARLLRANILQPLTDEKTINARLDCVQELSQFEETFYAIKTSIRAFNDVDHLITFFIQVPTKPGVKYSEQRINHIINLKHTLRTISLVAQAMTACENRLLKTIYRLLADPRLAKLLELINNVIEQNVVLEKTAIGLRNQRCFAVKAGCNGLLDVARQTYKETINDIFELANRYVEEYGVRLKLQFNVTMGYYLSMTMDQLEGAELPLIFINAVKKNKMLTFTTLELIKKNAKINDSLTEVYLMSDKIVNDLSGDIRSEISALYKASEAIAMLDMLLSFAHQCTVNEYTRPVYTDTLVIKQGRHPIIEKLYLSTFVPNDTYAGPANNFQIISGPNMSGKSTYLRQVALLTIMSHIGSFVPAEFASIRIIDQLFSRICNDDSVELNASTFTVEMKETAYILQNITERSLVVMDELGRGTSTHDGLGIAFAVCEELIHSRALVFFATHFQELTTTLTVYHNVVNLHLDTETTRDESNRPDIIYKYKLTDGRVKQEHYGLSFARTLDLPKSIMDRAQQVSDKLTDLQESARRRSESNKVVARRRVLAQIAHDVVLIQRASGRVALRERVLMLKSAQQEAINKLVAVGEMNLEEDH